MKVDVSIVCANYNNGAFLKDLIESVKNSTAQPTEFFIIDDGSTDDSLKYLDSINLPTYVEVIAFKENKGVAAARNAGIDAAKGKYIMLIDSDDTVLPTRIEKQYEQLQSNKLLDIVSSNCIYFNTNTGKELLKSNFPSSHEDIVLNFKNGENGVLNGTVMGKADWFKSLKFRQEYVWAEDYFCFARC